MFISYLGSPISDQQFFSFILLPLSKLYLKHAVSSLILSVLNSRKVSQPSLMQVGLVFGQVTDSPGGGRSAVLTCIGQDYFLYRIKLHQIALHHNRAESYRIIRFRYLIYIDHYQGTQTHVYAKNALVLLYLLKQHRLFSYLELIPSVFIILFLFLNEKTCYFTKYLTSNINNNKKNNTRADHRHRWPLINPSSALPS